MEPTKHTEEDLIGRPAIWPAEKWESVCVILKADAGLGFTLNLGHTHAKPGDLERDVYQRAIDMDIITSNCLGKPFWTRQDLVFRFIQ